MRGPARRFALGLATLLGLPRGFLIPYRHAAAAVPAGYPALEPLFEEAQGSFQEVVEAIEAVGPDLLRIAEEGAGTRSARLDQDWFPRLDAAAAYALVCRNGPRRILEVGSGHSTRLMARAVADGALPTAITCIDPSPRAPLDGLGIVHLPQLLGPEHTSLIEALEAGDVLFIDSSHVAMPGTDVDRLLLDGLPRLASGVLIHIHDIFLPDPYPMDWAWRGYNEATAVGALIGGGGYELVFASRWVATRRSEWLRAGVVGRLPLLPGAHESSLWLRKR